MKTKQQKTWKCKCHKLVARFLFVILYAIHFIFWNASVASDVFAAGKSYRWHIFLDWTYWHGVNCWARLCLIIFCFSFFLSLNSQFRKSDKQQNSSTFPSCWLLFTMFIYTKSSSITMYASNIDRLSSSLPRRCVSLYPNSVIRWHCQAICLQTRSWIGTKLINDSRFWSISFADHSIPVTGTQFESRPLRRRALSAW